MKTAIRFFHTRTVKGGGIQSAATAVTEETSKCAVTPSSPETTPSRTAKDTSRSFSGDDEQMMTEKDRTYVDWLNNEIDFQQRTYDNCEHVGRKKRIFATLITLKSCRKHFLQTRENDVYGKDD